MTFKGVKISNSLYQDFVIDINQIDPNESENRGSILWDLSPGPQDLKILKRIKISNSLYQDFLIDINQIDHKESDNRGPETLGSILKDQGPYNLEGVQNFKLISSKFRN